MISSKLEAYSNLSNFQTERNDLKNKETDLTPKEQGSIEIDHITDTHNSVEIMILNKEDYVKIRKEYAEDYSNQYYIKNWVMFLIQNFLLLGGVILIKYNETFYGILLLIGSIRAYSTLCEREGQEQGYVYGYRDGFGRGTQVGLRYGRKYRLKDKPATP